MDAIRQISDPYERYLKLSEYVATNYLEKGYETLSPVERDMLHVYLLETEVNNGGFDQYFFNTSGDYATDTVESLRRIGSSEALDQQLFRLQEPLWQLVLNYVEGQQSKVGQLTSG